MNIKKIVTYDIESWIALKIKSNIESIKLFFILFSVNILIYGQKIFFMSLANDDYDRLFKGGYHTYASDAGRWMTAIFTQHIFTGSTHLLPYLHSIISIFSFTLFAFLTAIFFKRQKKLEIIIVTLLISATPFLAHNSFFNDNVSVSITTVLGVISILTIYSSSRLYQIIGFTFLTIAIGNFQTIIQITLMMILIRTILDLLQANTKQQIIDILFQASKAVLFILFAFVASTIINSLYMEYYNLSIGQRYAKAAASHELSVYFDRIKTMYEGRVGFKYFVNYFIILYFLTALLSTISMIILFIKNSLTLYSKVIVLILIIVLFAIVPVILFLPNITGINTPMRGHYAIGWFLAGLFVMQILTYRGIFSLLSKLLALSLIILNIYYINVFFFASYRQTQMDILRANNIVTQIRLNPNYVTEPIKLKIVGKKHFHVTGHQTWQVPFLSDRTKYQIFQHFTDLKFTKMNKKEEFQILNYLINQGKKINAYPGKNSIIVYGNKVVVFLQPGDINKKINFSKVQK